MVHNSRVSQIVTTTESPEVEQPETNPLKNVVSTFKR